MTCGLIPFSTVLQSGKWESDDEMLYAMGPCLWRKRFVPPAGFKLAMLALATQCQTHRATWFLKLCLIVFTGYTIIK